MKKIGIKFEGSKIILPVIDGKELDYNLDYNTAIDVLRREQIKSIPRLVGRLFWKK